MYRAFNLEVDKNEPKYQEIINKYFKDGNIMYESLKEKANEILPRFVRDGIIDGTDLSDIWFKTIDTDVFISHSHNDKDLAIAFAGFLKREFNLSVFIDEGIWGSADELLKSIDDEYCKNKEENSYNYTLRNFSTSHVHAMLTTALMKIIDKTEAVIFLNTEETIPVIANTIKEKNEYTLSPWIYDELMIVNIIRERHWSEYRKKILHEFASKKEDIKKELKVKYRIPNERLTTINTNQLIYWKEKYNEKNRINDTVKEFAVDIDNDYKHALNCLYEVVFGKVE